MNIIGGLPRSGSTLLQNILNQNPKFQVSSTSCLPAFLAACQQIWSGSIELKGEQQLDKKEAEAKRLRFFKGMCENFYGPMEQEVFDKSRGWNNQILLYQYLFPDGKTIITVRDLRDVFASIEKQHRKDPTVDNLPGLNIVERAHQLFSAKGMIGSCLRGIQDIIDRKLDVHFVQAEQLTENPEFVLNRIYCYLLEDTPFEHNFKDVKNTSIDPDYIYWHKFPHQGCGPVVKLESEWQEYMSDNLAKSISQAFPWYNQKFGY